MIRKFFPRWTTVSQAEVMRFVCNKNDDGNTDRENSHSITADTVGVLWLLESTLNSSMNLRYLKKCSYFKTTSEDQLDEQEPNHRPEQIETWVWQDKIKLLNCRRQSDL